MGTTQARPVRVALADLIVDRDINIRDRIDKKIVAEYVHIWANLPPILVFRGKPGLYVGDGFHRIEAAKAKHLTHVFAFIRPGGRAKALEASVTENRARGLRLTTEDLRRAVLRMRDLHRAWSMRRIGRACGVDESTSRQWLHGAHIVAKVPEAAQIPVMQRVQITTAPEQHWKALVTVTRQKGWTIEEVRAVTANLRDGRLPKQFKDALLRGEAEPITHKETRTGSEPAILRTTVLRKMAEARRTDNKLALWNMLEILGRLRLTWDPVTLLTDLTSDELDHVIGAVPDLVEYLQTTLTVARKGRELRVVGAKS